MQKIEITHPDRNSSFVTGAYSDGIIVDGLLYVSGQAAVNFKTSKFVLGSIEEETQLALNNIKAIVEASGASIKNVIKCTVHLSDIHEFDQFNKVYADFFSGIKTARTTVQSTLPKGIKVEIDCIAKIT